jgi:acetyl esterase
MNWRLKLVLFIANLRKPVDPATVTDINALRKQLESLSALGNRWLDRPVQVQKVTDTTADGIPVRIYQNNSQANQRVMVYYHGGGFVLYHLDTHDNVCRRLCQMNNCIVVSVDYRLAPEFPYPAAHHDAYTALQWVIKNIHLYGGNPNNIVVAGDSAGGNLSACMAHRCKQDGIKLKAQVLIYPWIDGKLNNPSITTNGNGYLLTKETMFWFQKQYTPKEEDRCKPDLSPSYQSDCSGLAPAFVITAQYDPLLDDGRKYAEQLKEAGNQVLYKEYPELVHGFINLPRVDPMVMTAYNDIQSFLNSIA